MLGDVYSELDLRKVKGRQKKQKQKKPKKVWRVEEVHTSVVLQMMKIIKKKDKLGSKVRTTAVHFYTHTTTTPI